MSKKKWSVSERYLDQLWSQAIKLKYHGRCGICRKTGCHAHHIFPRRKRILRWDIFNGIYLCPQCHKTAHQQQSMFYRLTENLIDYESLESSDMTLVDYCAIYSVTKDEFRVHCKNVLKGFIQENQEEKEL